MATKQMVATKKVFDQQGVLRYPGEGVAHDEALTKGKDGKKGPRDRGLSTPSAAAKKLATVPIVQAAIAPAGPNPTAPQAIPVGANQTIDGYVDRSGAPLVAEGSEAALEIEEGGTAPQTEVKAKPAAKSKDNDAAKAALS